MSRSWIHRHHGCHRGKSTNQEAYHALQCNAVQEVRSELLAHAVCLVLAQCSDAIHTQEPNCRVSDLARLSLQDPEYISVHAEAPTATPHRLKQFYVTTPLHSKLDILWFFIKTHLKKRTIVFLATCKQVRPHAATRAGREWLPH